MAGTYYPGARPPTAAAPTKASGPGGGWSDQRAERVLGALASTVLLLIGGMIIYVFVKGFPSFSHNGLSWFTDKGNVDQQLQQIFESYGNPATYDYTFGAWPLIYGTLLTTGGAVVIGLVFSLLSAIFIVEFAPAPLRRVLEPVVRLLAAVPSVIYGLLGVLVLVPFIGADLISKERKESVEFVVSLSGTGLAVAVLILAVMITPIMIAIQVDALRAVPQSWTEGAAALGVNRWRVMWSIAVRTARPAIIAALVLATARALGEAIMLSMVAGSKAFEPNPLDGITFFFEPVRPLASTIVENAEGLSRVPFAQTIYAIASLLLISAAALSFGGWLAKQPLRRYGVQP